MIYENNLAIVITTDDPKDFARLLPQLDSQSYDGINIEFIIYNGTGKDLSFNSFTNLNKIKIFKTQSNHDLGCKSRDLGNKEANSEYICYWDDDNIYFPHAAISLYLTSLSYDIGIVNTHHEGYVIPNSQVIRPGYIDTMCMCVRKEIAVKELWSDEKGRYADYRYINKLLKHKPKINFSDVIIGRHL